MSTITVRLKTEEQKLFNEYAKLLGIPLSTLMKRTLQEKIEDEIDVKSIIEYERERKDKEIETCTTEELKEMLGL